MFYIHKAVPGLFKRQYYIMLNKIWKKKRTPELRYHQAILQTFILIDHSPKLTKLLLLNLK